LVVTSVIVLEDWAKKIRQFVPKKDMPIIVIAFGSATKVDMVEGGMWHSCYRTTDTIFFKQGDCLYKRL